MKKKFKNKKDFLLVALIFSALFILILSFVAGYSINKLGLFEKKKFNEVNVNINEIIEYNENLPIAQQIFNNCSKEVNASAQILCVKRWAVENYNYAYRDEVYSIDDIFEKGADCKSYAIYYATLAKMLGYDYAIFQLKDHVMIVVYYEGGYCVLDQDIGGCIHYGGGKE